MAIDELHDLVRLYLQFLFRENILDNVTPLVVERRYL
jgi:hypothetical protein